jgi:hypothetical protein
MTKTANRTTVDTARNVLFVLLGVGAFLAKPYYHGPGEEFVHSYAGNFFVSFALYFLVSTALSRVGQGKFSAVMCALVAVEAFEITNGFGVMSNVFDSFDLLANPVGIAAALAVEFFTQPLSRH